MAKKQTSIHVEKDVLKEFKKHCIDKDTNISEEIESLMKSKVKR